MLLASPDATILGGAFLVMERLAGRPLLDARRLGVASVLVEMQLRLHALDAEVLLLALDREGQTPSAAGGPPISRELVTFESHLARLERRIARGSLHGLEKAIVWFSDHRPMDERRRVICHGDFHPQNILMADGRVTGVIDWPNVIVADPAFDVASTRVVLDLVPVGLLGVPPALRGLCEAVTVTGRSDRYWSAAFKTRARSNAATSNAGRRCATGAQARTSDQQNASSRTINICL